MKIRQGFVSNSSSSSFVLGKCYMTDEQVEKFSRFIDCLKDYVRGNVALETIPNDIQSFVDEEIGEEDGGFPFETDLYFFGEIDQSMTGSIIDYLENIGVNKKYFYLRS